MAGVSDSAYRTPCPSPGSLAGSRRPEGASGGRAPVKSRLGRPSDAVIRCLPRVGRLDDGRSPGWRSCRRRWAGATGYLDEEPSGKGRHVPGGETGRFVERCPGAVTVKSRTRRLPRSGGPAATLLWRRQRVGDPARDTSARERARFPPGPMYMPNARVSRRRAVEDLQF